MMLLHLLSGVSDVLQDENVSLVGGHTCEGIELACGFSIQGFIDDPTKLWRKRGGRIGDHIFYIDRIHLYGGIICCRNASQGFR